MSPILGSGVVIIFSVEYLRPMIFLAFIPFSKNEDSAEVPFCSITDEHGRKCVEVLKEKSEGAYVSGITNTFGDREPVRWNPCIVCGGEANYIVFIAKS